MASEVAVGIDLGTTYSCVAIVRQGKLEVVANDQGERLTPSYVAFTDEERLVGSGAKKQASWNPSNTVYDVKRIIGRKYQDLVKQKMEIYPYKVFENILSESSSIEVTYRRRNIVLAPEEISAMVLEKMKNVAETYLGHSISDVVVTVPAYFNDSQRQSTLDASKIAGLNVIAIINEPTAAAIAYGNNNQASNRRNMLVFDLGGGTFDVAVVTQENGLYNVKAISGDTYLGGSDFDYALFQYFVNDFKKEHKLDLTGDKRAEARLRKECEKLKKQLSFKAKETMLIESLFKGIDYSVSLSRARFEEICSDLFDRILDPVKDVLKQANMNVSLIDDVILAGGSTRMPKIQSMLQQHFGGKELRRSINPDEAIAQGAALHAAMLSGDTHLDEFSVCDVTPLSLGISLRGVEMSTIIPRNSKIPVKRSRLFTTCTDNQKCVKVEVREGEHSYSQKNNLLGQFLLENIENAGSSEPQIEVTFEINKNGILKVTAVDLSTSSENSINVKSIKGRLSKEEISKMINDARVFRKDEQDRAVLEALKADFETYCVELKRRGVDKLNDNVLSMEEYEKIRDACDDAQEWLDDNQQCDASAVQARRKRLQIFCDEMMDIQLHE